MAVHSVCVKFGMPLNEYERRVTPVNKTFHELAEYLLLCSQGVLPLDQAEIPENSNLTSHGIERNRKKSPKERGRVI